jgi:hypothetical protein
MISLQEVTYAITTFWGDSTLDLGAFPQLFSKQMKDANKGNKWCLFIDLN